MQSPVGVHFTGNAAFGQMPTDRLLRNNQTADGYKAREDSEVVFPAPGRDDIENANRLGLRFLPAPSWRDDLAAEVIQRLDRVGKIGRQHRTPQHSGE
jgi:hypothetical protein